MSFSVNQSHGVSKTLGLPQDQTPQTATKSLGGAAKNQELAAWYEEAYLYYQNVQQGIEEMPEEAAWQEFLNQMQWAYGQLSGGVASGTWGNELGGTSGTAGNSGYNDPFGGVIGPDGTLFYDGGKTHLGYLGDGQVRDVFSDQFILDVASNAVDVTIEKVLDTSVEPPEEIIKITAKHRITGAEDTYRVHGDLNDIDIKINMPGGKTDNVHDANGLATIGEFVEGGLSTNGGIPEWGEYNADTDTMTYDGVAGTVAGFEPPFGGVSHHVAYTDSEIRVMNSDQVTVEPKDGGYLVTITDKDGKVTTIQVAAGMQVQLWANPNNVTFKEGSGGAYLPGGSGSLNIKTDGNPARADLDTTVAEIPEGWENFFLNGSGTVEDEGATQSDSAKVQQFLDSFTDPAVALEDIPANLLEEIQYGSPPPSQELLQFIALHDNTLKYRVQNGDWKGVRDRLGELLWEGLGLDVRKPSSGDIEDGLYANPDQTLIIDDVAYEFDNQLGLSEVEIEATEEAESLSETEQAALDQKLEVANQLRAETGMAMSAEDLVALAEEIGLDLRYLPSVPNQKVWEFLCRADEELQVRFNEMSSYWTDEYLTGQSTEPLRNYLGAIRDRSVELLQALYPEKSVVGEGTVDNKNYNDFSFGGVNYNLFPDWSKGGEDLDWNSTSPWDVFSMEAY